MKLKPELLKGAIIDAINNRLDFYFEIDADKIADTLAIKVLDEIKAVICNTQLDDFQIVEEIVCIFEKYNISTGGQHDF